MPVQKERDPKNRLRFFITVSEEEIGPVTITKGPRLNISDAEKLTAGIKKQLAKQAGKYLIDNSPALKSLAPTGSYGATEPYFVKRPKVGRTPAYYRVGLKITFNDPAHAQAFATKLGIP